jgi:acyl-CoA reductase-like NAD-dependent aldehyde dehydrogenase
MREIGHYIGGKLASGTSGKFGDVFNPAAGETTARVALASTEEVDRVATAARHVAFGCQVRCRAARATRQTENRLGIKTSPDP